MKSGLLWYNPNAANDLMKVIDEAAARYSEKYGIPADTCFCNRAQLKEFGMAHRAVFPTANVAVMPSDTVMPNYVWLGVSKTAAAQ